MQRLGWKPGSARAGVSRRFPFFLDKNKMEVSEDDFNLHLMSLIINQTLFLRLLRSRQEVLQEEMATGKKFTSLG